MTVLPLRYAPDPILRRKTNRVGKIDGRIRKLVDDMFETMYHAEGIGLAAPQIGLSLRLCVLDVQDDDGSDADRLALVNPEVVRASRETDKSTEGCLSIPGLEEFVTRSATVTVRATDPNGEPIEVEADGMLARALQHELDHLDGVLFIDRVSPLKRRMLLKKWKKSQEEDRG
ncbi:MAG: peptide deformylase [Chloroflexi bacterium]|nr:peptide deformylase [Chloroflexota bacterium]